MKKLNQKLMALTLAAVSFGSMGVATMAQSTQNIGAQKAKEVALSHAKLKASDVTFTKAVLDYDDGIAVYDVEFYTGSASYDYEIGAVKGNVREFDKDVLNSNAIKPSVTPSTGTTTAQTIGAQKAKEVALAHAKLKASDVVFTKAQLEYDNGVPVYDVEFHTTTTEYDYEIDAVKGTLREFDIDALKGNQPATGNTIGVAKAKEAELAHAKLNAKDVTFKKAVLDYDDGVAVYDIEFYKGNMEYEYEVRASDGKILDFSVERIN